MPIPKPGKKEKKSDFMDRCMEDDVMNREYPQAKQRFAICNRQWQNRNKSTLGDLIKATAFSVEK